MNISRGEQRTLHALAQGGAIHVEKDTRGKVERATCYNREGWALADCTMGVFKRLKNCRLIASHDSGPYRITRDGLFAVRSQLDNR